MVFFDYLITFFLSAIIELTAVFLLGFRKKKFILAVFTVNLFTHPLLNYFLAVFASFGFSFNLILIIFLEILVVLTEARLLEYTFKNQKFLKLSIIMNTASFLLGILLFWL